MSAKQDKATTERHARTLRELLKRPENKTCADCKRNDPRWASWNLGVFLCIRCSGIHRSMGTHISKVKSVDLDVWTPEQMASIQKWGNRRANLYWEAHLRAGHIPPDHKMESYIRSKYESRRWAREGPPPEDPAVLEADAPAPAAVAPPTHAAPPAQAPTPSHASRASVSSLNATRATQPHQLLSTAIAASRTPAAAIPAPQAQQAHVQQPQQQQQPQSAAVDLFSLDFHAPTSSTPQPTQQEQPKKDVKAEIMSLFSTAAPAQPNAFGGAGAGMFGAAPVQAQNQFGGFGGMGGAAAQANPWGAMGGAGGLGQPQQPQQQQQPVPQQTSMMGNAGVGMWGANSGWNAAPAAPAQSSLWATPAPASQQSLFTTSDVWSNPAANTAPTGAAAPKTNDAFGDLWGGFK
ncbi:ArfGap-domain-containing protein [Lentinus tigrinus ALCF2SS1-6]|uniref:ArfGap-domain-containing protein n=1 Tax=Lentinus tigrinus ALCF2SS1-6 TaxID=1328759 RepID=A0A5C2S8U3_9APHY|nr:ArfGap-domain-containing protein [Lentinus tigrinus ALCF2SS1-6]